MLKTLFRVNEREKIIIDLEAIKLCPGLKKVGQDDLLFIILAYDYNSPFKRLDEDERIRRAMRRAFGKDDLESIDRLKKVISDYRSLQYDERRETVNAYRKKVGVLRLELINENKPGTIESIGKTIKYLHDEIENLQEKIDKDDELIILSSGGKLTILENWQKNRKQFLVDQERDTENEEQIRLRKQLKQKQSETIA